MAKGGGYEREISRTLSLWWTGGARDDVFWRTYGSGGRATTRRKKGKSTAGACGDIVATDEVGAPFTKLTTTEVKRGYSAKKRGRGTAKPRNEPGASLHELLDPAKPIKTPWAEWIVQARTAAENAGTPYWAIIHRRDRRVALIAVPYRLMRDLGILEPVCDVLLPVFECGAEIKPLGRVRFVVMRLDAFLATVTSDAMRALSQT